MGLGSPKPNTDLVAMGNRGSTERGTKGDGQSEFEVRRAEGEPIEGEAIIDFTGTNPNCIDINGDLGLGFSERSQKATMFMKTRGLYFYKPLSD